MTDHSFDSLPSLNSRILDASDAMNRAAQMLDFLIDVHGAAQIEYHPGETWVLDAIADGIREAYRLLRPAPAVDPETTEAAAQKERIDRAIAESIAINTMKAAIAAHEARVGGAS